ncbi:response regulator [Desulfovibrio sulfodismutans]|uniref:Response regulator n=1 Tax=Desulfolutivibrio sulfodismutans TaxID=63561 RepID=A0A7K3NK68_9BACT|nr:response regulator [Desulfolutivibrio sulfodismutans]NDY56594.1 response regulator [Desulfolutivibrio sulfodismutans]QLA13052.1 response regulator [Desulfolutivibrio sulfodismutans DSM 3696]
MATSRILILDDEERIRDLLTQYLEDFDEFTILGAHSGEQALELLAKAPAAVAVVDMRLPGMSGAQFIREAMARGVCRHFLVHTGSVDMVISTELKELGLTRQDFFFKPAGADAILDRIRECLSQGDA